MNCCSSLCNNFSATFSENIAYATIPRRVRDNASIENGDSCTDNSLLDVYANREQYDGSNDIMNMNFVEFATKYKVVNSELTKLPENVVLRIFPTYSSNPKGPIFLFTVNISF